MPEPLSKHRKHGISYKGDTRASEAFDWERAIAGLKRILAEIYDDDVLTSLT